MNDPMNGSGPDFSGALGALARHPSVPAASDLYAPLLGAWDARVLDHLPDGGVREQSAEIHFARVLEGRAIQDVWIAPARGERTPGAPASEGNRYGSTLRVYDPALDAWRITWRDAVTGVEERLVGRRAGDEIVHTGTDAAGQPIRWRFVELGPESFHWRGERSPDDGRTWVCGTEFLARRRRAPGGAELAWQEERRVAWEWTDRAGLETVRLVPSAAGVTAHGDVLVVLGEALLRIRYRVEHDRAWRFRSARIETGSPGPVRSLDLKRDDFGLWTADGGQRPELAGCEDLDLMVTPYTNTPPLAARALLPGESRRLRVAWLRFPELDLEVVEQEYVRLAPVPGDGSSARYRYRNIGSGFSGELTVDADGLVLQHGPWRRR